MLSVLFTLLLIGVGFYFYIEYKYYELKLDKSKQKLRNIVDAKIRKKNTHNEEIDSDKYCPPYYQDKYNETRYNPQMKKFTCQFNPNNFDGSGFYFNSPDGCCNNRPKELNKILDLVLENIAKENKGNDVNGVKSHNVWCLTERGTKCAEFIDKCPDDVGKLSNLPNLPFKTEEQCYNANKVMKCVGRENSDCKKVTGCVWVNNKDKGGDFEGCVPGSGSGPYNLLTNSSVGYIHGNPTAVAGNSNPFVGIDEEDKSS